MDEAAEAANWLGSSVATAALQRVLLTGIVVTYARAFTNQGVGAIDRVKFAPTDRDERRLHKRLIDLRDRLYAHTDVTSLRWIAEDVRDVFGLSVDVMGIEPGSAVEIVVEPDVATQLPAVAVLAARQARRFRDEAVEARQSIGAPPSSGRRFTAGGIPPRAVIGEAEVGESGDG